MGPRQLVSEQIEEIIVSDLAPSISMVMGKLAVAFAIGGSAAWVFCAWTGMLMTPFGRFGEEHHHGGGMNHLIEMDPLFCAVLCGSLFAFAPALVLRALCSPMQFYVIGFKRKGILAGWLAGLGWVAWQHSMIDHQLIFAAGWIVGAWGVLRATTWLVRWLDERPKVALKWG